MHAAVMISPVCPEVAERLAQIKQVSFSSNTVFLVLNLLAATIFVISSATSSSKSSVRHDQNLLPWMQNTGSNTFHDDDDDDDGTVDGEDNDSQITVALVEQRYEVAKPELHNDSDHAEDSCDGDYANHQDQQLSSEEFVAEEYELHDDHEDVYNYGDDEADDNLDDWKTKLGEFMVEHAELCGEYHENFNGNDDDLKRRSEVFIATMMDRWQEEKLREEGQS